MKEKIKYTFSGFFKIAAAFILILATAMTLFACAKSDGSRYVSASKWKMSEGTFFDKYVPKYEDYISAAKAKYGISFTYLKEKRHGASDDQVIFYIYSEVFTAELLFLDCGDYGDFRARLFYYGADAADLNDYTKQKPYVDFVNELIGKVVYDARVDTNYFASLYDECIELAVKQSSYIYYSDETVGDVGYQVGLLQDGFGYYYKMQRKSDYQIAANVYEFNGILKAQK